MDHPVAASAIGNLPSAFAAACRLSRNDAELFERCREALVGRFNSTAIWFDITTPLGAAPRVAVTMTVSCCCGSFDGPDCANAGAANAAASMRACADVAARNIQDDMR